MTATKANRQKMTKVAFAFGCLLDRGNRFRRFDG